MQKKSFFLRTPFGRSPKNSFFTSSFVSNDINFLTNSLRSFSEKFILYFYYNYFYGGDLRGSLLIAKIYIGT
jgi:hypothetical protein